uniref:Uncharacterized protein n=1 Tax=Lactuca sativa TaxID=4236 RepID=A0A9R1V8G4_LACSA|nr:hypothetical protein LSAT_V11C600319590 [Lactuca sativa]
MSSSRPVPVEMTPDEIEKRLQDCPPDLIRYDRLMRGRSPVKYEFVDSEWIGKPGIKLERYSDEKIAALGRVVIPMLSSGFSLEAERCASIFVLAYHLKAPGSRFRSFIFNSDESLQVTSDQQYNSDPSEMLKAASHVIAATGDPTREAAVYSYIAASLFRLFTKPASHYVQTWSRFLNGFSKFYGEPMRVILPVPTVAVVGSLKDLFSVDRRAKVMLYRFLYMSNSNESHKGFKTFLYDNVLENTGMHILGIIEQLADVLNCSLGSIIITMEKGKTNVQMKSLLHVLKMMTSNDENHKRNMWRYGRIFDEAFLVDLQTKSCVDVVCVLAEALRSESPEKHSGIMQISQFADISEDKKRRCAKPAQLLLTHLKNQNPSSI